MAGLFSVGTWKAPDTDLPSEAKHHGNLPFRCGSGSEAIEAANSFASKTSRAYQLEMLQQSLARNVVVAMDTGSGKTQIAILRMRAQLETSLDDKIIWFLAPTVLLCAQQFEAIKVEIPSISIRLITGNDNAHTWNASTWKHALNGVQAIVSTYQILLDALDHAFISLSRISLLIFDEAHNCVGSNPGGKIMTKFYHFVKQRQDSDPVNLPAILGLTATPSMRAHIADLEKLEMVLSAKCISPSRHRAELLRNVKRPNLKIVQCDAPVSQGYTDSMASLLKEHLEMNILEDPYVLSLQLQTTEKSRRDLEKVLFKQKTWSRLQMSRFFSRSLDVQRQLGSWSADYYIWRSKQSFLESLESKTQFFDSWIPEEKAYLTKILQKVTAPQPTSCPMGEGSISKKLDSLISELISCDDDVLGIIFVKERVTAAILAAVLESMPKIREKYRIGCMVGSSNYQLKSRALYECFQSEYADSLTKFRDGRINLLVATSVLEEGIDVPACNLVMCFDSPPTPKSFIQRRGRARMHDSSLVLFLDSNFSLIDQWALFEEEIEALCQDSERQNQELKALEDVEEDLDLSFRVPSTGARLDQDNVKPHLEHFCRIVSSGQYTDGRPDYMVKTFKDDDTYLVTAEVILPASLPPNLRCFSASRPWRSEKSAIKDAAFQAYMALYNAGLLNKHLLPLETGVDFGVETRPSIVNVQSLLNPWPEVAMAWENADFRWVYSIRIQGAEEGMFGDYSLTLPVDLGPLPPVQLFLDSNSRCNLVFSPPRRISATESAEMEDHTSTLLGLYFIHRFPVIEAPHVLKFTSEDTSLSMDGIGSVPFDADSTAATSQNYFIRDPLSRDPHIYIDTIPSKPPIEMVQKAFYKYEEAPDGLYLSLKRSTRRVDFLHALCDSPKAQKKSERPYASVLPASLATVDSIDVKHARFGMLIPSIIHTVETILIARHLSMTLLKPVSIDSFLLLKEAISARSANESTHYERFELLGDSILKYCTSLQATATNLNWSESYLSRYKDLIVSNARLCRAALETGLSKFILTTPFTAHKWRPFYVEDVVEGKMKPSPDRKLSTKVLADVVEALIGISYSVGGIAKAIQCLQVFIGDWTWMNPDQCRDKLYDAVPSTCPITSHLKSLEDLIGYPFTKTALLLEATTHSSYIADVFGQSWERLEYIGDAVLDKIVVTKLANHKPPLAHYKMHMIKTTMVNKDFLAFLCLEEHDLSEIETFIVEDGKILTENRRTALWRFMRHSSDALGPAQMETLERHKRLREKIVQAMWHSDCYPWHTLLSLHAGKFYSDLMEAMIGAIWVDSGSLAQCESFLARCGMMPYMERLLCHSVRVQHPKEELGVLAKNESVIYSVECDGETHSCSVKVGGRLVGEGGGGLTSEEARVKAATEAVALLRRETMSTADTAIVNDATDANDANDAGAIDE